MATQCSYLKHAVIIQWQIENIRFWESSDEGRIESIDFEPLVLEGKCIRLVLFWKVKQYVEKYPCLSLICPGEALGFPIDCEVSLLSPDELPLVTCAFENQVINENGLNVAISVTSKEIFQTESSKFLFRDTLTLQCSIVKSRGDFSEGDYITTRTRIECLENSFLWPISGFRTLEMNRELTTPIRFQFTNAISDFLLKFTLKGKSLELAFVSVELETVSVPDIRGTVSLKASVLTKGERTIETFEKKSRFRSGGLETKISATLSTREELLKQTYSSEDDVLRLICEVFAIQCVHITEKTCFGYPYANKDTLKYLPGRSDPIYTSPDTSLANITLAGTDFCQADRAQYRELNEPDFELRMGELSFPVHKTILRCHSVFFENMFSNGMNSPEFTFMEIQDLDAHTLNQMLSFIYTDNVKGLMWDNVLKLYSAANQYVVRSLLQQCRTFLRWKTSPVTACDVLLLADKNKDDELKSFTLDYCALHFYKIMNSPGWVMLMDREPELAVKSMHQMYLKNTYKPTTPVSQLEPNTMILRNRKKIQRVNNEEH